MLKKTKGFFLLATVFMALLFSGSIALTSAEAASSIKVNVNGKAVDLGKTSPYLYNGTVMLPVRAMSEALGASVTWDGVHRKAYMLRGNNLSYCKKGLEFINVNGVDYRLKVSPQINNGSMYVSKEYIEKVFGFDVAYNKYLSKLSVTIENFPVYFAEGFSIKYLGNGCKMVTDGENFRILLVPRGQAVPKGILADKVVYTPVNDVLSLSSTFVGSMRKIGVLDSIKAVSTSEKSWYISEIKQALASGEVTYVGGDNMEAPDYELVKSLNPELVFTYTGDVGQRHIMKKFDSLGIKYAVNNEYLESSYLGRMEWIKFIAAFYDKELEAEKLFNDASKNIRRVKAKVANTEQPKVAWGLSWLGKVYVADPDCYVGKWISECGGDYVFKNIHLGSDTQVSMEDFYLYAKDADILIFSSTTNYMNDPSIQGIINDNPLFANIKAVKNGNVWAYAPDWWTSIPETDVIVKDISSVFHPEEFPNYTPQKLVKLPLK